MSELRKLGRIYRLAATGCAEAVFRAPWAEPVFVRASRQWWRVPGVGRFLRSVAYRLADRLFASGHGIRAVSLGGVELHLDVGEWTTSGFYFANEVYEPATVNYFVRQLAAGDVCVDVGANSGYFTVLAAALVGAEGRVVAFEPNPVVRGRLTQNIDRNRFRDRVRVETCALSEQSAEHVSLYVPEHDGFATLVPQQTHAQSYVAGAAAIDVSTSTFDDWLKTSSIDRIALVKIDVEGAELQVLSGMTGALATGCIARIVLETAWNSPAHRLLTGYGYVPLQLESCGPVDNIAYTR